MLNMQHPGILRSKRLIILVLFFCGVMILEDSSLAQSFPFRALEIGKAMPDAEFVAYGEGPSVSLRSFTGKPLLLALWGGDIAAKKKRAIKALVALQKLEPYLKEKGVSVLVVNMQNDPKGVVDEVLGASGLSWGMYKDVSQEAYRSFGVYVLPSLLLVDSSGKVSGGIGYSKDIVERLRGEVDIMLGSISREEMELSLNPEMKELPKEEKVALRHLQMGRSMRHKGMDEAAIREFLAGLKLNPALHEARIELGCLYLEKGDLDAAITELEAGLEGNSDSVMAEICLARVSAKMGELEGAMADLSALLFRNGRNAELHYTLGTFQQEQGDNKAAAISHRKAYELLRRKISVGE